MMLSYCIIIPNSCSLIITHTHVHTPTAVHACTYPQALAGEVGMSAELDEVAKSLYNGQIPHIWRVLAPATLKSLGNWMIHFLKRNEQYVKWVSE